ncbi:MAG: glycosyltransferase [bacterium]|nr:glycosyltransferase [bacterium]
MKRINVICIISSYTRGGAEQILTENIKGFNKNLFSFTVACLYFIDPDHEKILRELGVDVYSHLIKQKYQAFVIFRLYKIIKKYQSKILFLFTDNRDAVLYGTIAARLAGISVIIGASHCIGMWGGKKSISNYSKIMLPFIDKIIAVSATHKNYLHQKEHIRNNKIEVIYNGVDISSYSPKEKDVILIRKIGLNPDAPILGVIAGLEPEKGVDIFLYAAKKILDNYPETQFLIAGDGTLRKTLEELAHRLNILEKVKFLGYRADIYNLMPLLDIYISPSLPAGDNFSVVVLEAMACGIPVIATDVGSRKEQVFNNETGFLIDPYDSEIITEKARLLLSNKELSLKMGRRGREIVVKNFTYDKMIQETQNLFFNLFNKKKGM